MWTPDTAVYTLLLVVPVALLALGFVPKELCSTHVCRDLAAAAGQQVSIREWPFSGIDKTKAASAVEIQKLTGMFAAEGFSRTGATERIRFSKFVRQYYFLYIPIGADQLVIDLKEAGGAYSVLSANLIREDVGDL